MYIIFKSVGVLEGDDYIDGFFLGVKEKKLGREKCGGKRFVVVRRYLINVLFF